VPEAALSLACDDGALPRVLAAGRSDLPAGGVVPEHTLSHPEIDLISAGRMEATLNRRAQRVVAGGVYAYRAGDVYRARSADGVLVCRWVKFSWPGRRGSLALARETRLPSRTLAQAVAACDRLIAAHALGERLTPAAHLIELVSLIVRAGEPAARDRRIEAGLAFLERHAGRALLMCEVAEAAGMSEDRFARLFRQEVGLPPMQHLIGLRLRKARQLLAGNPALAVAEAARRSGFEDADHFARLFRRHYGVTPREFRSRLG
jgi:AraC-like DNA-binding protein